MFRLPQECLTSSVTLTAELNPDNVPAEVDYTNNTISKTVTFETVPPLKLEVYRTEYANSPLPAEFHQEQLISWLYRAYPVSVIQYRFRVDKSEDDIDNSSLQNLVDLFEYKRWWDILVPWSGVSINTRYYGMYDDSGGFPVFLGDPIQGLAGGKSAIGATGDPWDHHGPAEVLEYRRKQRWDTDGSYGDWMGGHEIGHTFDLNHVTGNSSNKNCSGSFHYKHHPDGNISPTPTGDEAIYGFDIKTLTIYPTDYKDLMTYCPYRWIDNYNYERLMDEFQNTFGIHSHNLNAQDETDRILILGSLTLITTPQVDLLPLFVIPNAGELEPRIPGNYAIVLRNAEGDELARYPFTPDPVVYDLLYSDDQDSVDENHILSISELVPYIAGTDRIDIEQSSTVLHTISAGPAFPSVTLTSPNGGETLTGDTVQVSWTASDPDSDPLHFNVQYSPDNGQSWKMLAINLTATSVEIDADNIAGSNEGLFRVWVSDGIHTANDQSDTTFTVPNHTPVVEITYPNMPITRLISQTIFLEGDAYDIDKGSMPQDQLQWISNIDGVLGNGWKLSTSNLSLGTHTITFQADDGAGGVASDTVIITIVADPALVVPSDALIVGPTAVILSTASGANSDTVYVDNQGETFAINWTATVSATWLQLDQTSGSTPGDLTVTFNDSGLEEGLHFANITFTSPDVPGQSVEIPVTVNVTPADNVYLPIILK